MSDFSNIETVQTIFSTIDRLDAKTHPDKIRMSFAGIRILLKQKGMTVAALDRSQNPSEARMENLFRHKQRNLYLNVLIDRCQCLREGKFNHEQEIEKLWDESRQCIKGFYEIEGKSSKVTESPEEALDRIYGQAYVQLAETLLETLRKPSKIETFEEIVAAADRIDHCFIKAGIEVNSPNPTDQALHYHLEILAAKAAACRHSCIELLHVTERTFDSLSPDTKRAREAQINSLFFHSDLPGEQPGPSNEPRLVRTTQQRIVALSQRKQQPLPAWLYKLMKPPAPLLVRGVGVREAAASLPMAEWCLLTPNEIRDKYWSKTGEKIGAEEAAEHLVHGQRKYALLLDHDLLHSDYNLKNAYRMLDHIVEHFGYIGGGFGQFDATGRSSNQDVKTAIMKIFQHGRHGAVQEGLRWLNTKTDLSLIEIAETQRIPTSIKVIPLELSGSLPELLPTLHEYTSQYDNIGRRNPAIFKLKKQGLWPG